MHASGLRVVSTHARSRPRGVFRIANIDKCYTRHSIKWLMSYDTTCTLGDFYTYHAALIVTDVTSVAEEPSDRLCKTRTINFSQFMLKWRAHWQETSIAFRCCPSYTTRQSLGLLRGTVSAMAHCHEAAGSTFLQTLKCGSKTWFYCWWWHHCVKEQYTWITEKLIRIWIVCQDSSMIEAAWSDPFRQ